MSEHISRFISLEFPESHKQVLSALGNFLQIQSHDLVPAKSAKTVLVKAVPFGGQETEGSTYDPVTHLTEHRIPFSSVYGNADQPNVYTFQISDYREAPIRHAWRVSIDEISDDLNVAHTAPYMIELIARTAHEFSHAMSFGALGINYPTLNKTARKIFERIDRDEYRKKSGTWIDTWLQDKAYESMYFGIRDKARFTLQPLAPKDKARFLSQAYLYGLSEILAWSVSAKINGSTQRIQETSHYAFGRLDMIYPTPSAYAGILQLLDQMQLPLKADAKIFEDLKIIAANDVQKMLQEISD